MTPEFLLTALITVAIYYLLTLALNLQYGYSGMINFGVHGFFGLGAYLSALFALPPGSGYLFNLALPVPLSIATAVLVTASIGTVLAAPALIVDVRSRSPYLLPIITLTFAETLLVLVSTEISLAGGFSGLVGIPRPRPLAELGRLEFLTTTAILILALATVATLIVAAVVRSPFGRVLLALRADEIEIRALGYNALRYQLTAFAMGSGIIGLAGALWAHYLGNIQPTAFSVRETILVFVAMFLGGRGNLLGTVVGSVLVFGIIEQFTRVLPFIPGSFFVPGFRQIVLGALLMGILAIGSRGLFPERLGIRSLATATRGPAND